MGSLSSVSSRHILVPLVVVVLATSWTLATPAGPESEGGLGSAPTSVALSVDIVALPCPAGYDNGNPDDICLGFDGQVPGPTFVFRQGDHVELTVRNRVAATVSNVTDDPYLVDHLGNAAYSLHRHGISVDQRQDGVAAPPGTAVYDSTVAPSGERTYVFAADFAGAWHYHDHTMHGSVGLGGEAVQRGLYGAFVVVSPQASTDHALDLHLTDHGANGGLGLDARVGAGERFDLVVTGLGDRWYDVRLVDPSGDTVDRHAIGPGVSRGLTVFDAQAGDYVWEATSPLLPGETLSGTIEVVP